MLQSTVEQRVRRWFFDDQGGPAARVLRLAIIAAPMGLPVLFGIPVCPSAALFHLPCPGCGLTRATMALLRGDLGAATALNPLAVVVCPLLAGAAAYAAYRYLWRGRVDADRWGAGAILIATMTALTAVWAARWLGYFGGPVPV